MQIIIAIIIGVVSGIITTFGIWTLHQLWKYVFSPKLQQYYYSSVLVDGVWNSTVDEKIKLPNGSEHNQKRYLTLNLKQKGSKVGGSFFARSESKITQSGIEKEKGEYSNQYYVEGEIRDNYLILNYRVSSRNRTGLGSFVLQIRHGGTKMSGGISYVGEGLERVYTIDNVQFNKSL